jgi:hypothetical protein
VFDFGFGLFRFFFRFRWFRSGGFVPVVSGFSTCRLLTCDLLVLIILSHQNRMLFQDSMIFHAIPQFPRPSLIIRQRRYQRKYHTEEISNFDISSV